LVATIDYRNLSGYELLSLGRDYEGSCPCSRFTIEGTEIQTHCWRVDPWCHGCGIHYQGDRTVAEALKPALDEMDWYGEWQVVEGLL
jgi:hypothetical protein